MSAVIKIASHPKFHAVQAGNPIWRPTSKKERIYNLKMEIENLKQAIYTMNRKEYELENRGLQLAEEARKIIIEKDSVRYKRENYQQTLEMAEREWTEEMSR